MIDKARRQELKMLKYKKRLRVYGLKTDVPLNPNAKANLYAFRSHGKPCSCDTCTAEHHKPVPKFSKHLIDSL